MVYVMDFLDLWGSSVDPTPLLCHDCGWTGLGCDLPVKQWKRVFVRKWYLPPVVGDEPDFVDVPAYPPENYEPWRMPVCPQCGSKRIGTVLKKVQKRWPDELDEPDEPLPGWVEEKRIDKVKAEVALVRQENEELSARLNEALEFISECERDIRNGYAPDFPDDFDHLKLLLKGENL